MPKRHDDALFIQEGAVNPSAIAHSIIDACREVRDEQGDVRTDPAIRLMVQQLAYICKTEEALCGLNYIKAMEECEKNSERFQAGVALFHKVAAYGEGKFRKWELNTANNTINFLHVFQTEQMMYGYTGLIKITATQIWVEMTSSQKDPSEADAEWRPLVYGICGDVRQVARDWLRTFRDELKEVSPETGVVLRVTDDLDII